MARYLSVQTHGGRCCGMKSIWNFPYSPNSEVAAITTRKKFDDDVDYWGKGVRKDFDFFCETRPAQKAKDRLIAKIEYIKKKRPQGLIEVTLSQLQWIPWEPTLLELGFKVVTEFRNSNTGGNRIKVYHMVYGNKE